MSRQKQHLTIGLIATMLMAMDVSAAPPATATSDAKPFANAAHDPYTLALRATIWGYPMVRAAQLREKATQPQNPFAPRPATVATAPLNRLGLARALSDSDTRIGVAPNNDTLYLLDFVDTKDGPFLLETPDFGSRYYIFQFGEADSSTLHSYGQGTHGAKLPPIAVVAPDYKGQVPKGAIIVRSQQRYMMIAGRILVKGESDLPTVHALQDKVTVRRWLGTGRTVEAPVSAQPVLAGTNGDAPAGLKLLADLGTVLKDWRPAPDEAGLVPSALRVGAAFNMPRSRPPCAQKWSAALPTDCA